MSSRPHLIARVHAEHARTEQDRSCHFFPVPIDGEHPAELRAYCGYSITPGVAEALDGPAGIPCMPCLMTAAINDPQR